MAICTYALLLGIYVGDDDHGAYRAVATQPPLVSVMHYAVMHCWLFAQRYGSVTNTFLPTVTIFVPGGLEDREVCSHALLVAIAQVPVNLADQHPAVLMPEPSRDGQKIDAGHDRSAGEKVPEIVKPYPDPRGRGSPAQRFGRGIGEPRKRTEGRGASPAYASAARLPQHGPLSCNITMGTRDQNKSANMRGFRCMSYDLML